MTKYPFSLSDISRASGVNAQTLKGWIARGYHTGGGFTGGGGPGQHRGFSAQAAIEFAVVANIAEVSHQPRDIEGIFRLAQRFAQSGNQARLPGMPFHWKKGRTMLGVSADKLAVALRENGSDFYSTLRVELGTPNFVILDASKIFATVCERLGLDPIAEMNAVYGKTE